MNTPTFPRGLFGVFNIIRRVRELNIDSNSFLSRIQSALEEISWLIDSDFYGEQERLDEKNLKEKILVEVEYIGQYHQLNEPLVHNNQKMVRLK